MTRRLILISLAALTFACLIVVLAIPAEAHGRCDHRDHSHRRWSLTRTWVERWTYVRTDPLGPPTSGRFVDTWRVGGRTVRVPSHLCGR